MEQVISKKYKEYFDQVFCLEVSEYWFDPVIALRNINSLLKKEGVLWISFHFIYPHHNPPEQDYLRYTLSGASKLLKETGFKVEEVVGREATREDLLQGWWMSEGMRPSKIFTDHNLVGCLIKATKI